MGNDVSCELIFKTAYLYEAEVDSPGLLTAVSILEIVYMQRKLVVVGRKICMIECT